MPKNADKTLLSSLRFPELNRYFPRRVEDCVCSTDAAVRHIPVRAEPRYPGFVSTMCCDRCPVPRVHVVWSEPGLQWSPEMWRGWAWPETSSGSLPAWLGIHAWSLCVRTRPGTRVRQILSTCEKTPRRQESCDLNFYKSMELISDCFCAPPRCSR